MISCLCNSYLSTIYLISTPGSLHKERLNIVNTHEFMEVRAFFIKPLLVLYSVQEYQRTSPDFRLVR